jgi:hypothetical protein
MVVSSGGVEAGERQRGGRHAGCGLIRLDWTTWVELGSPEYGLLATQITGGLVGGLAG